MALVGESPPRGPGAVRLPRTQIRGNRSELLDCIRAVAIIMVVFFHVSTRHGHNVAEMDAVEWFFRRWGSKGVDIFFPLSGYLITLFLLSSTRADTIKVFFMRRFFRIVPLYVAAVTLALIAMIVTGKDAHLIDRIWINYTFLTSWFIHVEGRGVVPYEITWSLSVEEFAYILFGLVAWMSRRSLPLFMLAVTVLAIVIKVDLAAEERGFYFLPPARLDSIAIGGLTAWLMLRDRWPLLWLSLALAVCAAFHVSSKTAADALIYTEISLVVCILIVLFERLARNFHSKITWALAGIGFYSYFTYLFHLFTIEVIYIAVPYLMVTLPPFWLLAGLTLGLTHGAAVISYRVFEGPMMRLGRSLEPPPPSAERDTGRDRV